MAEHDLRARARGQLAMSADEVGVEVRLDDVGDREAALRRLLQVDLDVALRIHDGRDPLGADQVGRLGEAGQVELLEVDHAEGGIMRRGPRARG